MLLALLAVAYPGGEHAHRFLPVLVLGARILAFDHDAGGQVRDADRRFGLVHMPATRTGSPVGVDTQFGRIEHHSIEFVPLGPGRALVVLVNADGHVENRVIETPPGVPPSALQQASNYLNSRLVGRPLGDLRRVVAEEMAANHTELDELSAQVVETGLATWSGEGRTASLIVRGQAKLLSDVTQIDRLSAIQGLFERLEAQETMVRLLDLAEQSDGVRIFIGAESGVFATSGVSMIVAPARGEGGRIMGAIGVIGPTRINYGRIIPVVDYTARG